MVSSLNVGLNVCVLHCARAGSDNKHVVAVLAEVIATPIGRADADQDVRLGEAAGFGFRVHPHMLRHACGFKLANAGVDTRSLQAYLGHKNIQHTVRASNVLKPPGANGAPRSEVNTNDDCGSCSHCKRRKARISRPVSGCTEALLPLRRNVNLAMAKVDAVPAQWYQLADPQPVTIGGSRSA